MLNPFFVNSLTLQLIAFQFCCCWVCICGTIINGVVNEIGKMALLFEPSPHCYLPIENHLTDGESDKAVLNFIAVVVTSLCTQEIAFAFMSVAVTIPIPILSHGVAAKDIGNLAVIV